MRICKKCKSEKGDSSFEKHRNVCKECRNLYKRKNYYKKAAHYREYSKQYKLLHSEKTKAYKLVYNKAYYQKNKEKFRATSYAYYKTHRKRLTEYTKNWRANHKERAKYHARKQVFKIKMEVLIAYSRNGIPSCACCNEKNPLFLSIDHILNNGAVERKLINATGYNFYYYLKKYGFPQNGYQILCYNCNFGKRYYQDCPHKIA